MTSETATISPARGFIEEHAHYLDDAGFWERHAVRLGGPVLDLGCASGRITVPIARRGVPVIAVDEDPEMIAVLETRATEAGCAGLVTTTVADMAAFVPPPDLALVIVPMNTLQVLLVPDDRQAVFNAVAGALRPGGEFIFDLSVPDFDDITARLGEVIATGRHRDPASGTALTHTAVYDALDLPTRTLDFRVIIDRRLPDGTRMHDERPHRVHLYDPAEVQALVAGAGLAVRSVHAGFHAEPFDAAASERQVWRCTRPEVAA